MITIIFHRVLFRYVITQRVYHHLRRHHRYLHHYFILITKQGPVLPLSNHSRRLLSHNHLHSLSLFLHLSINVSIYQSSYLFIYPSLCTIGLLYLAGRALGIPTSIPVVEENSH